MYKILILFNFYGNCFIYLSPLNSANKSFNKNDCVYLIGCVLVGFLKFLKREKKSLDELDLPPAPPPLEGFEESELPELPEFPELEEKISAPREEPKFDFPGKGAPEFPKEAEFPEMSDLGKEELPEFPEMQEVGEEPAAPLMSAPIPPIISPQIPEQMPAMPEQKTEELKSSFTEEAYPKITGRLFAPEKRALRERPTAKTIYVKVDKFKATLGSINMVRSDLRKSEEALMKLENIKSSKDKSFDKLKLSLDDLQEKLIFIDKTLFKGE